MVAEDLLAKVEELAEKIQQYRDAADQVEDSEDLDPDILVLLVGLQNEK